MADEVEMIPVAGAEPPKADPLAKPASDKVATIKLTPVARASVPGAAPSPALKPGLKLPPKPGFGAGLKLPPKPGLGTGLKLPPKPGLKLPTQTALKPGIKLPPKPGLKLPTQTALKPGIKLPPKPVIRKPGTPGAAVAASPLPKPMEVLKTVTQKLKGITQEIPQQAVLHKTGIIAEGGMSDAQKEAAKHKTARISLADAMGVAPVKDEAAPMKTIRIKRPIDIPSPTSTSTLQPQPKAAEPAAPVVAPAAAEAPKPAAPAPSVTQRQTVRITRPVGVETAAKPAAAPAAGPVAAKPAAPAATVTQRKTLKIARPGGVALRSGGKFGVKRPSQATTIAKAVPAAKPAAGAAPAADGAVADIPDIPNIPTAPAPAAAPVVDAGPAWLWTLSALLQFAACVAIGALAWYLYENTQLPTYCGGLGWGQ